MSHDYCQDPKCQAGAHEVDWTAGSQERSAQPGRDATIRRNCMPVADGTSERAKRAEQERDAARAEVEHELDELLERLVEIVRRARAERTGVAD